MKYILLSLLALASCGSITNKPEDDPFQPGDPSGVVDELNDKSVATISARELSEKQKVQIQRQKDSIRNDALQQLDSLSERMYRESQVMKNRYYECVDSFNLTGEDRYMMKANALVEDRKYVLWRLIRMHRDAQRFLGEFGKGNDWREMRSNYNGRLYHTIGESLK